MIQQKKSEIEGNLLNCLCVVFNGMRFPVYISQYNYVILEYTSNDLSFYMINPQSEINILIKASPEKPQKIMENNSFFFGKSMKIPSFNVDITGNFVYLHENIVEKLNIVQQKPYLLQYKLLKGRNHLQSLGGFLKKLENFGKKEGKKPLKQFFCFIKPLSSAFFLMNPALASLQEENYIYFSAGLMRNLNLKSNFPVKIELNSKIIDYSKHKIMTISDFISPKMKISIYFFPIFQTNFNEDNVKQEIAGSFLSTFLERKLILIYSSQIFWSHNLPFAIKIVENSIGENKKNLIEMLAFEENRRENLHFNNEDTQNMLNSLQERIIITKYHDFVNNFPEKTINSYSIFVKRQIEHKEKKDRPEFLKLVFENQINDMKIFIDEFLRKQKSSLGTLNCCLLYGVGGTGKSSIIKHLKRTFPVFNFEIIDFTEITSIKHTNVPPLDITKTYVERKVQMACMKEPTIVVLKNVHLASKNVERIDFQQSHEILVSEVFTKFLKDLIKKYQKVLFFLQCESKELLNQQFQGIFSKEWEVKLPNFSQRKTIFEEIAKGFEGAFPEENLEEFVNLTENFNLRNFDLLYRRSVECKSHLKEGVAKILVDNIHGISNKTFKSNK